MTCIKRANRLDDAVQALRHPANASDGFRRWMHVEMEKRVPGPAGT
jgi:hypothetical protein